MKTKRKRSSLLALCLGITLALSACQPSPDKEVVVGKDQIQDLVSNTKEAETAAPKETAAFTEAAIKESTFQKTYEPAENLRYIVDATVKTYDSSMPVLRAKPHEFTSEEVRSLAEYFFQGQTAYETRSVMTKEQIEKRILDLTQWANDTEGLLACANNEEEARQMKEQYEKEIRIWEERYQTAPEKYQPKECDWQFYPETYFDEELEVSEELYTDICEVDKNYYIKASATVNGREVQIEALNRTAGSYLGHSFSFGIPWSDSFWMNGGTTGTEEEAQAAAEQLLKDLGMSGQWKFQTCYRQDLSRADQPDKKGGYTYNLRFLPVYENFPLSDLPYPSMEWDEERYAPFYNYEELEIIIADGEVVHVSWSSPLDVTVENPAVAELSFDQIMERFGEQMEASYPLDWFQHGETCFKVHEAEIKITEIQRGFARILVPDATMEYYLIPAWSFYGVIGTRYDDQTKLSYGYDTTDDLGNTVHHEEKPVHRLTLNALDGSVVNTLLGY